MTTVVDYHFIFDVLFVIVMMFLVVLSARYCATFTQAFRAFQRSFSLAFVLLFIASIVQLSVYFVVLPLDILLTQKVLIAASFILFTVAIHRYNEVTA